MNWKVLALVTAGVALAGTGAYLYFSDDEGSESKQSDSSSKTESEVSNAALL